MRILIILFSQTGHTARVAERIRSGLQEAGAECALVPLAQADGAGLGAFDLVGLGCPVFYYQEPLNVHAFIESLPALGGQPWFFFCTHGTIIGDTFASVTRRLSGRGARVIAYHDAYADATLPFYPHPTYTTGHPDDMELEAARRFGAGLVDLGRRIAAGDSSLLPVLEPVPAEWVENAAMFTPEFLARAFPPLAINPERCSLCLECERGCPVGGIEAGAAPPRVQKPCIYCWHCVNLCPEAAIEADWSAQVKLAPRLYARYRHWLDVAARQGRFRWLVDPEGIDFGNPYHRQRERQARGRKQLRRK
jgi:flavodoxin/NAD-dependent dihydropyrimidine dehydrogenase PreA subunit